MPSPAPDQVRGKLYGTGLSDFFPEMSDSPALRGISDLQLPLIKKGGNLPKKVPSFFLPENRNTESKIFILIRSLKAAATNRFSRYATSTRNPEP